MATLAVRNNNPGNLKDPATGSFRVFQDPQQGEAALEQDLTGKVTGNTRTGLKPTSSLYDFASTYAPSSDNNDPKSYAEKLAAQLGVTPDTPLSALQGRIHDFAAAVAHNEDSSAPALGKPTSQPLADKQVGGQLSHEQMIANINAMEQQGAKPQEIQGYLDSLKQPQQPQQPQGVSANALGANQSGVSADNLSGDSGNPFSQYANLPSTTAPENSDSLSGQLQGRATDIGNAVGLAGTGIGEAVTGHPLRGLFDTASGVLQTGGAVAGGVGDVIGAGLGLIPGVKQAEGLLGKAVGSAANTPLGQKVVQGSEDFAAKHPVLAKDLGSAFNIGSLAVGGIGGKVAKDAAVEGATQAAREGLMGGLVKGVAQKSAVKEAEEILGSKPTKSAIKSAVRSGKVVTEGGVPGIATDPLKQASINEVARAIMEGKIPKGLVADKAGAIKKAADDMAIELEHKLGSQEITPIVQPEEIDGLLNQALAKIGEDPTMVGNAEESAKRILNKFRSFLPADKEMSALDILQARKKLDAWIGGLSGGSKVFDPSYENAKSIALRAVRQGANDLVAAKAPDVAVKELLQRQSALYRALDYIVPNVQKEIGTTRLGRFTAKHPVVSGVLKKGVRYGAEGLGVGAGLHFLGE